MLKKKVPFTNRVHLSDTVLDEVKDFKDLGILTDEGLSFISHIDMITAKANRMLVLIRGTCIDLKDEYPQTHCTAPRLLDRFWNTGQSSDVR